MATARRTATSENVQAFGTARTYTSVATWESDTDIDLVTATQSEVLECYDDEIFFDFGSGISLLGATTDASYFRIIRPASGHGHDGTANVGVTFSKATAGSTHAIALNEGYSQLQDLILRDVYWNDTSTNRYGFALGQLGEGNLGVGLIGVNMLNLGSGTGSGYRAIGQDLGKKVVDSQAINCESLGFAVRGKGTGTTPAVVYNCTGVGSNYNFYATADSPIAKNCLGDGGVTADFALTWGTSNNNASSDATAVGTDSRTSQTFTFDQTLVDKSRDFVSANSEYFVDSLRATELAVDESWWLTGWINFDSVSGEVMGLRTTVAGDWQLEIASGNLRLGGWDSVSGVETVSTGTISSSTWYFFYIEYDKSTKQLGIRLDGGSLSQATAFTNALRTNGNIFLIGTVWGSYVDGRMQQFAHGRGAVLSSSEIDDIYNSGTLLPFEDWAGALQAKVDYLWKLNEADGPAVELINGLTIADTATVGSGTGKADSLPPYNYHLDVSDGGARGKGADLSSDSDFAFDDDIDTVTTVLWSIGADCLPGAPWYHYHQLMRVS